MRRDSPPNVWATMTAELALTAVLLAVTAWPAWAHHSGPGAGGPWTLILLAFFVLGLGLIIALNILEDRKARRSRKRREGSQ